MADESHSAASDQDQPLPDCPESDFDLGGFRIFSSIPEHHHDVVALRGLVVVYDTDSLCRGPIEDGGFYVVERQRPVAGLSWESYDRFHRQYPDEPRTRVQTSREVVQTIRCPRNEDRWWHRLSGGFHDGPYYDWAVSLDFVGKVVGIYQPAPHVPELGN